MDRMSFQNEKRKKNIVNLLSLSLSLIVCLFGFCIIITFTCKIDPFFILNNTV